MTLPQQHRPTELTAAAVEALALLDGNCCPLGLASLPLEEHPRLLSAFLQITELAHQDAEFEYTLRRLLLMLSKFLDLDFAGFALHDGNAYGIPYGVSSLVLAEEFTQHTDRVFRALGAPSDHPPVVIWNRRTMQPIPATTTGTWATLMSWSQERVRGAYLLHFRSENPVTAQVLRTLVMATDQCLNAPDLMHMNEVEGAAASQRHSAVKEMLELFREVNNPDFSLQYLLILLGCCRVDRGILWSCHADGTVDRQWSIGVPEALAADLWMAGEGPLLPQILMGSGPLSREESLQLTRGQQPEGAVVGPTQECQGLVAFPLIGAERVMGGVALLDARLEEIGGEPFLEMVGNVAASYLEASARHRQLLRAKDLENQAAVAHEVQKSLTPTRLPVVEGYELVAWSEPAKQVGGDFYHVHPGPEKVHVTIGDVSGKGIPAGLLMSMTRVLFNTYCELDTPPGEMLARINHTLVENTPNDRFVTAFHFTLERETGVLECWNAGHDPLLILRAATGEVEAINPEGMILGILEGVEYQMARTTLHPGDLALLFTDGLVETMDEEREQFGEARVISILQTLKGATAAEIMEALLTSALQFAGTAPTHDDTTLVLLRAEPAAVRLATAIAQVSETVQGGEPHGSPYTQQPSATSHPSR